MFRKVRRITREIIVDCYNACFNQVEGYVIMLHRIGTIEHERLDVIEDLNVSEKCLQEFIDKRRQSFDFISLDDLYFRIKENNSVRKPFICFTLDDGYKDNLTNGLPFFERNNVPFAVFVTTGFIDNKPAFNFPFLLERIIRDNDSLDIDGKHYSCMTRFEKNRVFLELKEITLQLPYLSWEDSFSSLFRDYLRQSYYDDYLMSWEEIRHLAESPLCTIGSHTVSHCRLSSIPSNSLFFELNESKQRLEEMIGKKVSYLSYPFGWTTDISEKVFESAKKAGYRMAFISHGGGIRKKDRNLYCLKREMLLSRHE